MIYSCCDPRRRERVLEAIGEGMAINGIDSLEVLDNEAPSDVPRQQTLLLRFLDTAPDLPQSAFELSGGERVTGVQIEWVERADAPNAPPVESGLETWLETLPDSEQVLVLRTSSNGDHSTYRLRLVHGDDALRPPDGIDRVLSVIDFSFKVECPTPLDCAPKCDCPEDRPQTPPISYLAKDYQSFRRLMLGRMTQLMPDWKERNPADVGVTIVEALAYTADRLSYVLDAVATEAYLATARQRSSLRRHARLVDYRVDDGANARAWIHVEIPDESLVLPFGTRFLTRLSGFEPTIALGEPETRALALDPLVFESLERKDVFADLNRMDFYEWSDTECCLPKGATRATLIGNRSNLAVGDVLIFEEVLGPRTGEAADADPARRHAVKLTAVQSGETDMLTGADITEIRWAEEDALPFPFCISSRLDDTAGGGVVSGVSQALGNILLADHGRTIENEDLGTVPAPHLHLVTDTACSQCKRSEPNPVPPRFRPALAEGPVSQVADLEPNAPSAFRSLNPLQKTRRPDVMLNPADSNPWTPLPDLLASDDLGRHFVVETEADGTARLRFGDETNGRRPRSGTAFVARYRVGNGLRGNVGREAIAHVLTGAGQIAVVRNPLAATGGREAETMEQVRQAAPYAFRRQERAVTEADYAEVARRFPDVQRASATFRWNGHGHTVFVTVDRFGGRPITTEFEAGLIDFLDRYRMAGYDLEIDAPRFVALEIVLFVCADREHFRSQIKAAVLAELGSGVSVVGVRGFFHPDNFSFGDPVYLSTIYARVMAVEGVASVSARIFRRRGRPDPLPLENGILEFGRLEIAQLENDPNFPERGSLVLEMGGGK